MAMKTNMADRNGFNVIGRPPIVPTTLEK